VSPKVSHRTLHSLEDPIALDELDEKEVKHDPFEFPHDDKIPFSRLLFDSMV
jgi:hypothetical protein